MYSSKSSFQDALANAFAWQRYATVVTSSSTGCINGVQMCLPVVWLPPSTLPTLPDLDCNWHLQVSFIYLHVCCARYDACFCVGKLSRCEYTDNGKMRLSSLLVNSSSRLAIWFSKSNKGEGPSHTGITNHIQDSQ